MRRTRERTASNQPNELLPEERALIEGLSGKRSRLVPASARDDARKLFHF